MIENFKILVLIDSVERSPVNYRFRFLPFVLHGIRHPEYVAAITRIYRDCVDRLHSMAADGVPAETLSAFAKQLRERHAYAAEMAFSRGFCTGWLRGVNNRELVGARFGKKRGVFLGAVSGFGKDGVFVRLRAPLKPGDGVVFDAGTPEEKEEGGYVYGTENVRGNGETFVRFARGGIRWERVRRGDGLWKTSDPALTEELRATFSGDKPRWARKAHFRVFAETGKPLRAECSDGCGNVVSAEIGDPLAPAESRPATDAWLREQFGRLGGTGYYLDDWRAEISGNPLVPASVANKLRRALVEKLNAARENAVRWTLNAPLSPRAETVAPQNRPCGPSTAPAELIPVVRELAQLDAALAFGAKTVYAEFENPRDYRVAAERVHAVPGAEFWAQPPRVFKEAADEAGILRVVRECGADGFLVRAHEHFYAFAGMRRRGDFSLNAANHLSADYFLRERGLERVAASYDMNAAQLCALLERVPAPEKIEVTLHQRMPMFHMEHCVFCAFLSEGKNFRDCGRPCEKHVVRLRDRTGAEHAVKADAGCRNTVFNARAQTGAEFFGEIRSRGVRPHSGRVGRAARLSDEGRRLRSREEDSLRAADRARRARREVRSVACRSVQQNSPDAGGMAVRRELAGIFRRTGKRAGTAHPLRRQLGEAFRRKRKLRRAEKDADRERPSVLSGSRNRARCGVRRERGVFPRKPLCGTRSSGRSAAPLRRRRERRRARARGADLSEPENPFLPAFFGRDAARGSRNSRALRAVAPADASGTFPRRRRDSRRASRSRGRKVRRRSSAAARGGVSGEGAFPRREPFFLACGRVSDAARFLLQASSSAGCEPRKAGAVPRRRGMRRRFRTGFAGRERGFPRREIPSALKTKQHDMYDKTEIINNYKLSEKDTGSSEVQIALLSARIAHLTEHLRTHKKDFHSRHGLIALTNRRRKLLNYLKKNKLDAYEAIIRKLGLRR